MPPINLFTQPKNPPPLAGCSAGTGVGAGAAGRTATGADVEGSRVATAGASACGFLSLVPRGSATTGAVGMR